PTMRPVYSDGAAVGPNLTLLALIATPPPSSGRPQRSSCSSPSTPPRVSPVSATETRPFASGPASASRPSSGAVNGACGSAAAAGVLGAAVLTEASSAVGVPARLAQRGAPGPARYQASVSSGSAIAAAPAPTRRARP